MTSSISTQSILRGGQPHRPFTPGPAEAVVCDRCGCEPITTEVGRACPAGGRCLGVSARAASSATPVPIEGA
jgi:hypothetical protein